MESNAAISVDHGVRTPAPVENLRSSNSNVSGRSRLGQSVAGTHGRKSSRAGVNKAGYKLEPLLLGAGGKSATGTVHKSVPSFFETEEVVNTVAAKNPTYEFHGIAATNPTKILTPTIEKLGKHDALLVQVHNPAQDANGKLEVKSWAALAKQPSEKTINQQKENEAKKLWFTLKKDFRMAFEENQGRQLCLVSRQMEDDCKHLERTLVRTHKRKVILLYHLKYLARALRKNCLQSKHAADLDASVAKLIKETMATQQTITHKAGIVNLGLRSQLHQMHNILWSKLGMKEYRPKQVKLDFPAGTSAISIKDQKSYMLHVDGVPDIPRMDQIEMLLDPVNFQSIASKPNGLLLAQQFIIGYLKQCAEISPWMDKVKISYPTAQGLRTALIKNLPTFKVDVALLAVCLRFDEFCEGFVTTKLIAWIGHGIHSIKQHQAEREQCAFGGRNDEKSADDLSGDHLSRRRKVPNHLSGDQMSRNEMPCDDKGGCEPKQTLFDGLVPPTNPIKLLKDQFPAGDVEADVPPEIQPIAPLFRGEPFSSKDPVERRPAGLLDSVRVELPGKLTMNDDHPGFVTFEQFAAQHIDLFQFTEAPHVSPNRRSSIPMNDQQKPPEELPSTNLSHLDLEPSEVEKKLSSTRVSSATVSRRKKEDIPKEDYVKIRTVSDRGIREIKANGAESSNISLVELISAEQSNKSAISSASSKTTFL